MPSDLGTGLAPAVACALLLALPAAAAGLTTEVVDAAGEPVADAVVVVREPSSAGASASGKAMMDQVDKTYVPHVLPVQVGTVVEFPNNDDIRHHVYSFSDAKHFELPLYQGTAAPPVIFDRPGVVVLGCNIHDFMRAYIYVVDSPHFAVTGEDGEARIDGLAPGSWQLEVWHPRLAGDAPAPRSVEVGAGGGTVRFALELKPSMKIRRAPTSRRSRY
ncbi:MAG TPA: methylamine utilization protein [Thermoanaerobaculia bacterium]|nr:methylamine utilization protein [Thermoanaerobaculia bacterium]